MHGFAAILFIFSFGAFFVPILSRYLRIPVLVGEILYGILLRSLLYEPGMDLPLIDFLSQMGFIFIMFLAGLELNFDKLDGKTLVFPLVVVSIIYVCTFLVWSYLPESGLKLFGEKSGFFALVILSTMSVGLVFIGLKSRHEERSESGQRIIWVATVGELLSILLIIVFEMVQHAQGKFDFHLLKQIGGLATLIIGAYLLIRLILRLFWSLPKAAFALDSHGDMSEMAVRLAFLIMLTMVALADYFRLELILGAFLGGMMLSFVFREKTVLEHKLSSIGYGFFIPFFFIRLGWDFHVDLDNLAPLLVRALTIFGLMFLVRLSGTLILIKSLRNKGWFSGIRNSVGVAFLLSAPLTLLVAVAQMGLDLNVITDFNHKALILCAMLGGVFGPIGFGLLYTGVKEG